MDVRGRMVLTHKAPFMYGCPRQNGLDSPGTHYERRSQTEWTWLTRHPPFTDLPDRSALDHKALTMNGGLRKNGRDSQGTHYERRSQTEWPWLTRHPPFTDLSDRSALDHKAPTMNGSELRASDLLMSPPHDVDRLFECYEECLRGSSINMHL